MMQMMSMSDQAFLWETEAIRSSRDTDQEPPNDDWLTLREASAETGISVTTLRRWARNDRVASFLKPTRSGQLRMVSRDAVLSRAASLGRSQPSTPTPPSHTRKSSDGEPRESEPDRDSESPAGRQVSSGEAHREGEEAPAGTMLVPIDAWDKMLIQLGNLHQAGQELAEARERAARAETEVRFLKERLAERRSAPQPEPLAGTPVQPREEPSDPPARENSDTAKTPGFTRLMWRAWRTRPKA